MKNLPIFSIPIISAFALASGARAAIVAVDFESGLGGLSNISEHTNGSTVTGQGTNSSVGYNNGADQSLGSALRTIDSEITFSMEGLYNGNNNNADGGMSFGWSQTTDFNTFNGSGPTNHVWVGITSTSTDNGYRLSAVNGAHSLMDNGNFGTIPPAVLTAGNWYRLSGGILFDSNTNVFTFNNIRLDDIGATGTSAPSTILSGTGAVVSNAPATFGDSGARVTFNTNRDRGFEITDNYSAIAVPETSTALLGFLSAGGLLLRRRR